MGERCQLPGRRTGLSFVWYAVFSPALLRVKAFEFVFELLVAAPDGAKDFVHVLYFRRQFLTQSGDFFIGGLELLQCLFKRCNRRFGEVFLAVFLHMFAQSLYQALGCIFTILWGRGTPTWGIIPRLGFKYTRLLSVGFAALLLYQVMMYFYISPGLNIERIYLPTVLRTFGYAIFFSTMTLYLKELIEFPTFFHALTVSGFIRNGVAESMCSGLYSYGLRHQINDTLARGIHGDYNSILMVAVKEMFGIMCIIGTIVLLLMLLYDVQPVKSTMHRMPKLKSLGKIVLRQLRLESVAAD